MKRLPLFFLIITMFLMGFSVSAQKGPTTYPVITPINVQQLQVIADWGRGSILNMAVSPAQDMLAVISKRGLWIYSLPDLSDIAFVSISNPSELAWHPDGSALAVSTQGGEIQIWNSPTWQMVIAFPVEVREIHKLIWSPDGTRLATARDDETVKIWDAQTGQKIVTLEGNQPSPPFTLIWNSDGTRLAAGYEDEGVRVWDALTGEVLLTLHTYEKSIYGLTWSPDGKLLMMESPNNHILEIWDATVGKRLYSIEDYQSISFTTQIYWTTDSSQFILLNPHTNSYQVWDIASNTSITTQHGDEQAYNDLLVTLNQKYRVEDNYDSDVVNIWDTSRNELVANLTNHFDAVWALEWSPDSRQFAVSYRDGTIRIGDGSNGTINSSFNLFHSFDTAQSFAWSSDSTQLAFIYQDEMIIVRDTVNNDIVLTLNQDQNLRTSPLIVWLPNSSQLVELATNQLTVYDLDTSKSLFTTTLPASDRTMSVIEPSPDGMQLALGNSDGQIFILDTQTWETEMILDAIDTPIQSLNWSADGQHLASSSTRSQTIKFWNLATHEVENTLSIIPHDINAIAWHPFATLVAISDSQGAIHLWDIMGQREIIKFDTPRTPADHLAFSPDGTHLVTASGDGTLQLWVVRED